MSSKGILTGLRIGVIGSGNMGRALVQGLVEKSVYPQNIRIFDIDKKKLDLIRKSAHVKISKSARECVSLADIVILAVKPKDLADVCADIATGLGAGTLVISVAAGVTLQSLASYFQKPVALVRVMPNMPALVGAGMSAFSMGKVATGKHRKITEGVLAAVGEAVLVPERLLDLVTAVSGSGPAYYFLLTEKLIEAAYENGMKLDIAKKLAYQTALGSGRVLMSGDEDPDVLISRVASKGGTTEAALKVFQKQGFGKLIQDAVKAALRRSKELSRSA